MVDATFAIAVSGLTIAAAVAVWNVYSAIFRDLPKLNVTASYGRLDSATGLLAQGGRFVDAKEMGDEVISLKAVNVGHRIITVNQGGIELENRGRLVFTRSSSALPHELGTGQMITFWTNAVNLVSAFRESEPAFPYCRDVLDSLHKGSFDEYVQGWVKQQRGAGSK